MKKMLRVFIKEEQTHLSALAILNLMIVWANRSGLFLQSKGRQP
jgi:hypothetical protein